MSTLYGALFSGVSALFAQSGNMASISDNIANVNTTGYKRTTSRFSTLVTDSASRTRYSPGGVLTRPYQQIDRQGLIQSSAKATDVAISGQGFFVVNTQTSRTASGARDLFTRAGSFDTDKNGLLINAAGYYLQGYKLDPNGNVLDPNGAITTSTDLFTNLQTISLAGQTSVAQATRSVTPILNLPPTSTATAAAATTNVTIFDSLGAQRALVLTWNAGATLNQWTVNVSFNPTSITVGGASISGAFTVNFNNAGQLVQVGTNTTPASSGILSVTGINFSAVVGTVAGVSQPTAINFNLGTIGQGNGLTQVSAPYSVQGINQDGVPPASLTGVSIDASGFVTAQFANGLSSRIYRIGVATFQAPNGLQRFDGNTYVTTEVSGDPNLRPANTGISGQIIASALENSTVDIAEEFSNMIITQRAYNAATRIITTADEMLDELVRLKR
jgi:flagellar hook protein FlgE